jgi:hypothetical protein
MTDCRNGFPSYEGLGMMLGGWAITFEDSDAGLTELIAGFERWKTSAGPLISTYFALLLGDALRRADRLAGARAAVEGAIAFGESHGAKVFLPLLARFRAKLE